MEIFAMASVFISITLLFFTVGTMFVGNRHQSFEPPPFEAPKYFGSLNSALAGVWPTSDRKREQLQKDLLSSGNFYSTALDNFLASRNVAVMCVWLAFGVLFASGMADELQWQFGLGMIVSTIIVFSLPRVLLSVASEKRKREIEFAFPDVLDMVSMAIEGGLSVEQSLRRVAKEFSDTHASLCRELGIVARQAQTGSLGKALSALGDRVDIPDVAACAITLRQGTKLGVGISESMREAADRMRETRKQNAEQAGNLASIKLLLPVVLCMAPPVFVLLIGPAILDFREFINREKENAAAVVEKANTNPVLNGSTNVARSN